MNGFLLLFPSIGLYVEEHHSAPRAAPAHAEGSLRRSSKSSRTAGVGARHRVRNVRTSTKNESYFVLKRTRRKLDERQQHPWNRVESSMLILGQFVDVRTLE